MTILGFVGVSVGVACDICIACCGKCNVSEVH